MILHNSSFVLGTLIFLFIWVSFPEASAFLGASRKQEARSHLQKRTSQKSSDKVGEDGLMSGKMDAGVMSKLGNMHLESHPSAQRSKREHLKGEKDVEEHILKAEADAIASAEESSAAQTHSVDAAVEVAQAQQNLEQSGLTFEENDVGQMVHIEDPGQNAKESHFHNTLDSHQGNGGDNFATVSRFHLPADASANSGHGHNRGSFDLAGQNEKNSYKHFASNDFGDESDSHLKTADVETPILKLHQQSTELGKETQMILKVIAEREERLVAAMESFKKDLQSAIQLIQQTAMHYRARHKRWDSGNFQPYKACVYVTPPEIGASNYSPPQGLIQDQQYYNENELETPAPLKSKVVIGSTIPPPVPSSGIGGPDIDFRSIYWLKLPNYEEKTSLDKVGNVLTELRQSGRDMLLIPVKKGFADSTALTNAFFTALSRKDMTGKSVERKLRLKIRRI